MAIRFLDETPPKALPEANGARPDAAPLPAAPPRPKSRRKPAASPEPPSPAAPDPVPGGPAPSDDGDLPGLPPREPARKRRRGRMIGFG